MTYQEAQSAIDEELQKDENERDVARLKKYFRVTHKDRRRMITTMTDGVPKVLQVFPLLKSMKFVSMLTCLFVYMHAEDLICL